VFQQFVSALEGLPIEITRTNFPGLSDLTEEFGFHELSTHLSVFGFSDSSTAFLEDGPARLRIFALEERVLSFEHDIGLIRREFADHLQIHRQKPQDATAFDLSTLRAEVSLLRSHILPPHGVLESHIAIHFPEVLAEFRSKRFVRLWRGSRHGFGAAAFHRQCDGPANTLTLILDTKGNVFGGFTPLTWDSESYFKADDSLESFLFTIKNPAGVSPRKFPLNPERKGYAIDCDARHGPDFFDVRVCDDCHASAESVTSTFGMTYRNDTNMGGPLRRGAFLTGSENFRVKEIEVFELVD
jgi:hypothetical protein